MLWKWKWSDWGIRVEHGQQTVSVTTNETLCIYLVFCLKHLGKNFGMDCNYFDTIHPWKWQKWPGCAGILFPPTDYRYVWTSIELLHCPHSPAHIFSKQSSTYVCQTLCQVQHGNRHSKVLSQKDWNPGRQHQASPSDTGRHLRPYPQGNYGGTEEPPCPETEC